VVFFSTRNIDFDISVCARYWFRYSFYLYGPYTTSTVQRREIYSV